VNKKWCTGKVQLQETTKKSLQVEGGGVSELPSREVRKEGWVFITKDTYQFLCGKVSTKVLTKGPRGSPKRDERARGGKNRK